MANSCLFTSNCESRLAIGFVLLSLIISSTPTTASEPDCSLTFQVIRDLADARLRGAEIELRIAEQKLSGTTQLRELGHASIPALREARLEFDAA